MMDDVYLWIQELITYHKDTGDLLQCHYVPNLTSTSKLAKEYEKMFLELAVELLAKLPSTVGDITHVTSTGRYLVVMFSYDPSITDQTIPAVLQGLDPAQFLRVNKIP